MINLINFPIYEVLFIYKSWYVRKCNLLLIKISWNWWNRWKNIGETIWFTFCLIEKSRISFLFLYNFWWCFTIIFDVHFGMQDQLIRARTVSHLKSYTLFPNWIFLTSLFHGKICICIVSVKFSSLLNQITWNWWIKIYRICAIE